MTIAEAALFATGPQNRQEANQRGHDSGLPERVGIGASRKRTRPILRGGT